MHLLKERKLSKTLHQDPNSSTAHEYDLTLKFTDVFKLFNYTYDL